MRKKCPTLHVAILPSMCMPWFVESVQDSTPFPLRIEEQPSLAGDRNQSCRRGGDTTPFAIALRIFAPDLEKGRIDERHQVVRTANVTQATGKGSEDDDVFSRRVVRFPSAGLQDVWDGVLGHHDRSHDASHRREVSPAPKRRSPGDNQTIVETDQQD